mmetsp:Transcript_37966/g.121833  ORF Transcript_37966/g.121833 Transcript_37966/m.121833 type:complete len:291 (+) Transcript_37966:110-982(+)|eukprot:CAMPEP_0118911654 /NCGR_PEP_ID=MMETSP1166-20130328/13256_1 /TAXON_ID=1104430 /ORGANISM="Chrysoreinhardia sp, Strain CCMP3193" /LENGTH=290 /DNA_ID=CAMNT_0006851151 /DNA_START=11 /DNA_END=883 /DNA_ORIENTATION=+
MDSEVVELSRLVRELRGGGGELLSEREVARKGLRAQALRRRLVGRVRQFESEARGTKNDSAASLKARRARVQVDALSDSLSLSLRSGGLAYVEDRERLLDGSLKAQKEDDARKANASLSRARDLLRGNLEEMKGAHDHIDEDEAILRSVEAQHKQIADGVRSARAFVRRLRLREQRDHLKILASVALFYAVVLYILWRRLPLRNLLRRLISLAVSGLLTRRSHSPTTTTTTAFLDDDDNDESRDDAATMLLESVADAVVRSTFCGGGGGDDEEDSCRLDERTAATAGAEL